jgi:rRNA maturation endonuclease Nob1
MVTAMGIRSKVVDLLEWDPPERPYECLMCGVHLDVAYHTCPKCGSFTVDRRNKYR